MYRIDVASADVTLPTPAAAGTGGYWTNGNPGTGAPPTVIDADWLNMVQEELISVLTAASIVPSKTTYNQLLTAIRSFINANNQLFTGGTTTGTANAQVLATVVPTSGFSLSNGYTVIATAGFTNTGSTTINVASSGVVIIKKVVSGSLVNLAASDLTLNQNFTIQYNSTASCWVLQALPPLGAAAYLNLGFGVLNDGSSNIAVSPTVMPVLNSAKSLSIAWASNTTISMTAAEIILENSSSQVHKSISVSWSLNSATTGAGGLDTGSIANNSWYYIYDIYNGTTDAGIMSLSSTGPTLPSGYTFSSGPIGAALTDSSGHFIGFKQKGKLWQYVVGSNLSALPILASGSNGNVWTATSVTGVVPTSIAASIQVGAFAIPGSNTTVAPNGNYSTSFGSGTGIISADYDNMVSGSILLESTNIYYAANASSCFLQCIGFTLN